jgi:hypothetical protein
VPFGTRTSLKPVEGAVRAEGRVREGGWTNADGGVLSSGISDPGAGEVGEVELLVSEEGVRRERGETEGAHFHFTPLKAAEMLRASQVTNSSSREVPSETVTSAEGGRVSEGR